MRFSRILIRKYISKIWTASGWLVSLVLLALIGLDRFPQRATGELSSLNDLRITPQVQGALVTSGDPGELAEILDQAMVIVPAGEFLRGSDGYRWDERPEKLIQLDAFQMDQYEVTNVQYRRFLLVSGEKSPPYWNGLDYPTGQVDYPVVGVTWEQASTYCQWAGKRLPTEAEWEKACRSADGRLYPWGNRWQPAWANLDPQAGKPVQSAVHQEQHMMMMYDEAWAILRATPVRPGSRGLRPVGSYPEGASPFGVLDMAGNASEWVADWYIFADYSQLADHDPFTSGPEWNHALRGSAWFDPNGSAAWQEDQSRCSARNSSHTPLDARTGFRCARDSD